MSQPCLPFLQISSQTKKAVRVIRGYKLDSPYGPSEGYRYDGLYVVEKVRCSALHQSFQPALRLFFFKAWQEKGLNPKGYLVCKFAFKVRLPAL